MNGHPAFFRPSGLIEAKAPQMICIDRFRTFEMWVHAASFHPPCTVLPELHGTTGTLLARPSDCLCPTGALGAQPVRSRSVCDCVCCVIRCDTKTSLSSSLCQPAALHWKPALTAMALQPDWTSDPSDPSAIEMVLKSTNLTFRPLDYCIDSLTQRSYLFASSLCLVLSALNELQYFSPFFFPVKYFYVWTLSKF